MISKETIEDLENDKRDWLYILGTRMRGTVKFETK